MTVNVLVIGGGGREHAICWKLAQCSEVKTVFAAPGNAGTSDLGKVENVSLVDINDFEVVCEWARNQSVSLVVVGPEAPLAGGLADVLTAAGIDCFGPSAAATRLESDKAWAKAFMDRHDIPTARWAVHRDAGEAKKFIASACYPALVVKASGLAAGKGVIVAASAQEACSAIDQILTERKFGSAGDTIVIEELLQGEEVSVLGFSDGRHVAAMLPAQDHKRALDGDRGGNTGGMGAYCPCPLLSDDQLDWVRSQVLEKAVAALAAEGTPFVGVLYAGLMITPDGPRVLEFNCRFGDPEAEVILPLLQSDLYHIMKSCCNGTLGKMELQWHEDMCSVGVVMASHGYPETSSKGDVITGVHQPNGNSDHHVFHCGTARSNGSIVTNGGRVLVAVALARELPVAAARALQVCFRITFPGAHHRTDIAHKGIPRWILQAGSLTYKAAGVDIAAGDTLVNRIRPFVGVTFRPGAIGSLGGFGALFDTRAAGFTDPILVTGTDGVGTKLKIAQACGVHNTIGIDLVAMSVNDVLCQGAQPLLFLDYFASGHLEVGVASEVVSGVAHGCKLANCALVGGETAEMPGLYSAGEYDLAGFALGAVERDHLLPRVEAVCPGDVLIGLPSTGLHSNGYSLVRKVMADCGLDYGDIAPFSRHNATFGEELLTPTAIYPASTALFECLDRGMVKALAHITGGGLLENIPRVLPPGTKVVLDATAWTIQPVFAWLAATGGVSEREMLRTFNCGLGMVLIVSSNHQGALLAALSNSSVVGQVLAQVGDELRVQVHNFTRALEPLMKPFIASTVQRLVPCKRVGVLISGTGTNLQSLIDATSAHGFGAQIVLVISNKAGVQGLARAQAANIPTQVIPHIDYATRADFESAVDTVLMAAGVELVCLAGFMRVLTGGFVRRWRGRLINIHPALLPSFKGTHAHRQALLAGVRITGCTVHFVEEEIDAGAILVQEAVPINIGDTEETLSERVKLAEHRAYPRALQLLATGKVQLDMETGKLAWK